MTHESIDGRLWCGVEDSNVNHQWDPACPHEKNPDYHPYFCCAHQPRLAPAHSEEEAATIGAGVHREMEKYLAPPGGALGYLIQCIEMWDREPDGTFEDLMSAVEEAREYVVETSK